MSFWVVDCSYFNPRSPWGERLLVSAKLYTSLRDFNPRSPWGERLSLTRFSSACWEEFQSTLPVGGATGGAGLCLQPEPDFNPRSPWGERLAFPG